MRGATPTGPEFAEMAARFAPFTYNADSDKLVFRGYGSIASPAWQRAILAWAQWTTGETISGHVCASCRTAMSWFLDEVDGQPGICKHLTVLNYGYATAETVPCTGRASKQRRQRLAGDERVGTHRRLVIQPHTDAVW